MFGVFHLFETIVNSNSRLLLSDFAFPVKMSFLLLGVPSTILMDASLPVVDLSGRQLSEGCRVSVDFCFVRSKSC